MNRSSFICRVVGSALVGLIGYSAAAGAVAKEAPVWSKRGVFVFGEMLFDFEAHDWSWRGITKQLSNCSTADYFCAETELTPIALPRSCRTLRVGQQWIVGNVTTRVVGISNGGDELAPGRLPLYLAPTGKKNVVFAYSGALGVSTIYFDPADRADLVQLASEGRLSGKSEGFPFAKVLVTRDVFGACVQ